MTNGSNLLVDSMYSLGIPFWIIFFVAISGLAVLISLRVKENRYENMPNSLSYAACKLFLQKAFASKKKQSLIYIYLHNDNSDYSKDEMVCDVTRKLYLRYLATPGLLTFKMTKQSIVVCFKDASVVDEVIADINERFKEAQEGLHNYGRIATTVVYIEDITTATESFRDLEILLKNYIYEGGEITDDVSVIRFDSQLIKQLRDEMQLSEIIDYAANHGGVSIVLQPIFSVKDNRYVAAESFIRMKDEKGSYISPRTFIPVAIKYNKMAALGASVVRQVCAFYEMLNKENIEFDTVYINASGNEIENPEYTNAIIDSISKSTISPEKIGIELNNLESVKNREQFVMNLESIRMFGITIAVSDFGSSTTQIGDMVKLPIDGIKLDVGFVKRSTDEEPAKKILNGVMDLSSNYGLRTVAVGVETEEQKQNMIEHGINFLQGRYYSDVMSDKELLKLIVAAREEQWN